MRIFFLCVLLILGRYASLFAQTSLPALSGNAIPSVIPPTPEAFALTRYGNNPIGLSTGAVQYSLPLYTISTGTFSMPLSVSYSSNGLKVDEVSGRVGMQWKMDFAGIITRTVIGDPDEWASYTPSTNDVSSTEFYNFLKVAGQGGNGAKSFQPDIFTYAFPGYSGKFIINQGTIVQIPYNNLKIEKTTFDFTITTPEGVVYSFGNGYYDGMQSNSAGGNSGACIPENGGSIQSTSWYLTSIRLTNGDFINYVYESITPSNGLHTIKYLTGVNQTYTFLPNNRFQNPPINYVPIQPVQTCFQLSEYTSMVLKEIQFPGGKVSLSYSGREDIVGEKKLDALQVSNLSNQVIKLFQFNYDYSFYGNTDYDIGVPGQPTIQSAYPELRKRLFLTRVEDRTQEVLAYTFEYESIHSLPPRLSYAQDYWGYFNGIKNQMLFPAYTYAGQFNDGGYDVGADRMGVFEHSRKGMLKKITYPTGGSTSYEYQPALTADYQVNKLTYNYITFNGNTASTYTRYVSGTYTFSQNHFAKIQFSCSATPWTGNTDPTAPQEPEPDQAVYIKIIPADADPYNDWVTPLYSNWGNINTSFNYNYLNSYGAAFKIVVYSAYPLPVHFDVNIDNPIDNAVRPLKPVGGITVKSIVDNDGAGNLVNRRNFIYDFGSVLPPSVLDYFPDNSSDEGMFYSTIRGTENDYFFYMYQLMSNTTYGLYVSDYSTITFPKVTEQWIDKNGVVTGGIEHEYMISAKGRPVSFGNQVIPDYVTQYSSSLAAGAQSSNGDLHNGTELKSRTYKMVGSEKRYMRQTDNHYSIEPSTAFTGTYYAVQQLISRNDYLSGVSYFADYNVSRYYVYSNWLRLDETITTTYTDAGDALQQTQQFQYANTVHMQPTLVKTFDSRGQIKTTTNKYPHDFAATGPYGDMVNRHIITPVIEQVQRNETTLQELERTKNNYSYLGQNTLFRVASVASSVKGNLPETDVTFNQYDDKGNVLQYTGRDGVVTSFIWGYNKQYPVAKITGRTYAEVVSQSGIDMSVVNNPSGDNVLRTELNKIRALTGCLVTSYTYAPLVGMTSQTDAASRTTYYEYDAAGRLHLVRDQNNNIVKKICYNYYGQPVNCN